MTPSKREEILIQMRYLHERLGDLDFRSIVLQGEPQVAGVDTLIEDEAALDEDGEPLAIGLSDDLIEALELLRESLRLCLRVQRERLIDE